MEMWRKYIYGYKQRLTKSNNAIVAATVSACRLSSNFFGNSGIVLFTLPLIPDPVSWRGASQIYDRNATLFQRKYESIVRRVSQTTYDRSAAAFQS